MAIGTFDKLLKGLHRAAPVRSDNGLTDGQLLECFIAHRDEAAFDELVRRHGPMVFGVCRRLLGNDHDAEDAYQASFLVLVRKAASVLPREKVGNWLYGVAYRTALEARTLNARRRAKETQVQHVPHPTVEPETSSQELRLVLDQELSHLPAKYRVAVILCDLESRTRKDVARQLNLPEGTISSRLATARKMLAGRLTRRGFTLASGAVAAALARHAAAAPLPTTATSLVKTAMLTVGGSSAAGVISAEVAALTEGVLRTMLLTKLKTVATVVLGLGMAAFGLGVGGMALSSQRLERADAPPSAQIQPDRSVLAIGDETPEDNSLIGSGKEASKKVKVADFTSLEVHVPFQVTITSGDTFSTVLTADDNVLPHIGAVKEGSTLKLFIDPGIKQLQTKRTLRAAITMPTLAGIDLSSAAHVTLEGMKSSKEFRAKLTGASSLKGTLEARSMEVEASAASTVDLKGAATKAMLSASTASRLGLRELALGSASVTLTGASWASVNAKAKLDYALEGASKLEYQGKPTIGKADTSGASSVSRK